MVSEGVGQKAVPPPEVAAHSVVKLPEAPPSGSPPLIETSLLYLIAQQADEITPWGQSPKLRDRQLREFIPTESLFASALGIVNARNAAFSWNLEGPPRVTKQVQEALEASNFGKGWQDLILTVSADLYTQDHGAFVEVVREGDSPEAPLLALNHLDSERCYHTGRPDVPVIYQDRENVYHELPWWSVFTLAEMPSPEERFYGLQWCALSRMMLAAQVTRNIAIFQREKTGGRNTKVIHLVSGMTTAEIQDAVQQVITAADSSGLLRWMTPVIAGSVDPKAHVDVKTLELASLPEGWDEDKVYKWYINQIAMAFLTDYQEFAPLPGGGLGTSTQSQVLHLKSRGKGSGLFMKLLTQRLNFQVLPAAVQFEFEEQDLEAEAAEAGVKKTRAETRKIQVDAKELTPEASRQEAFDAGDISEEVFESLGGLDITPHVTATDEEKLDGKPPKKGKPPPEEEEEEEEEEGEKEWLPLLEGLGEKAATVGDFLQSRLHRMFTQSADDLYALGYMDTVGRIQLSSVIGGVLRELESAFDSEVSEIVSRNVADADARAIVAQMAEKALDDADVYATYHPFWLEGGRLQSG